jgi:hypothetical protein
MPVTANIYQENAVRYLGTYGVAHQGYSTTWRVKDASMFAILCSTDVAAYSSSFAGTVQELLAGAVDELATANGYFVGGIAAPLSVTIMPLTTPIGLSFLFSYGNGLKYFPNADYSVPLATLTYKSIQWGASGGSLSAKSLILCIESPISTAATLYERSYPLVMIDFGGTRTAAAGTAFDPVTWNANGAISWTR